MADSSLPPLTQHQRTVLDYMLIFLNQNDQLPPAAQIARDFGYASPNSATCTLDQMEKKGYLIRNELGRRMFARPVLLAWREQAVKRQTLAGAVERAAA